MSEQPPVDDPIAFVRRVQAEVEAEAEHRRRVDPALTRLERDIERAWAGVTPPGAVGPEGELLLDRLDRLAMIDVDAPVGGRPGASQLKTVVRKLTYWYVRYLADQINALNNVLVRLLRRFDERLDTIEDSLDLTTDRRDLVEPVREPSLAVARSIATVLRDSDGMVAVVSCGAGGVVGALSAAAVRAYGIDADATLIVDGVHDGLDLRPAPPIEHLRSLQDESVAGLVLAGFAEDMVLSAIVRLAAEATRVVRVGGSIVVAVADPMARDTVERELRRGRGVAPATWAHILERAGCDVTIEPVLGDRIDQIVVAGRQ